MLVGPLPVLVLAAVGAAGLLQLALLVFVAVLAFV